MSNPRLRRLNADYGKVRDLCTNSGGTIRLLRVTGDPPTSYVIEYHCPSLVKNTQGKIDIRKQHQVEFNLGGNYPFEKPKARMLTPVFNPHVFTYNSICLGVVWSAAETLDTLILKVGALLQLDPKVLDSNSPANNEANIWVQQNRSKIPLGTVSFGSDSKPESRIQWF